MGVRAPRVVVASDAFKGSLESVAVGEAVRSGLLDVVPGAVVEVVGIADGGEGTVSAAVAAGWRAVEVAVSGPTGEPVTATLAVHDRGSSDGERVVLVELADACGSQRLSGGVTAPLTATSRGVGQAIRAALDLAPAEVVVGVGGSASTDGGAGMLAALGARVLDAGGREVADGGAALAAVTRLDLEALDPRLARTRLVLAADVDSPLLGPTGAAAVFAPQKGATPADVDVLEAALTHWSTLVAGTESTTRAILTRLPGAGAAGGVGFALLSVLGAERRSGVDTVLDLVGLDARLAGAELVVTGEGSLDTQTLAGKAVSGVARRAAAAGIPVVAVCGRSTLDDAGLATLGVRRAYALRDLEPDRVRSMAHAADLLRQTARTVAREWLSPAPG
ncbi:glycerate kinase [Oryzobacter terrae]|uniref:glycerate kinase n=1 Tax=Oryzobacter terrae TaxID=1620385 RepID=UPI00366F773C